MNIDDLKETYLEVRAPMDASKKFLQALRRQEKLDKRYIISRRLLPVSVGIIVLVVLLAYTPIQSPVMLAGCLLIVFSLLTVLGLYILEYVQIVKESFDSSLTEFLDQKEKRLRSWKSTPLKYHLLYACYIAGVLMMILGNAYASRVFVGAGLGIYAGTLLFLMLVAWMVGEIKYRKRHERFHKPLLDMLANLKRDLQ